MLGVILTILKILGIILLVILGLILLLALIVLFVPIRYRSKGYVEKTDDGIRDDVVVRVTWLLHIVSVRFNLKDNESDLSIRIFGKELNKNEQEKVQSTKKQADNDSGAVTNEDVEFKKTLQIDKKMEQTATTQIEQLQDNKETAEELKEEKPKKSFKQKILDILDKIKNICDKIKNINAAKDAFIEYLKKEESKLAIREIKSVIFKAIKHILPRKFKADVWFGFNDPATTGKVLGGLSIFYGIYGKKLNLNPNFEKEELKLRYELKGRIRVFSLLMAAFKIYRNKWIKEFITFSKETISKV